MSLVAKLLPPANVLLDLPVSSKKRLFEQVGLLFENNHGIARSPLSDARIAQILGQQGIVVARRTIAKYRESLQIPPVSQRKSL